MRLVTISWVRNEADIIEAFVRHHAPFADRMIIIDNGSTDDTPAILASLNDEGLPLDLRGDPTPVHHQSKALTALLREAAALDADWILPLDADEFLAVHGSTTLDAALNAAPRDAVTLLPWKTYVPRPSDSASEPSPPRRIRYRRDEESPQFHKALVPGPLARLPDASLSLGSHLLYDGTSGPACRSVFSTSLALAHFPVRNSRQFASKIAQGWARHLANPDRKPGEMYHWEKLLDRCASPAPLTPEELEHIALTYARTDDAVPGVVPDPLMSGID